MCLIALAIGQSQASPLLLASNRDEFFDRPTLALARWRTDSGQTIVSGRDLAAGGTWLGLTPSGRVAMLTNVREPGGEAGVRSRGELPLAWLQSRQDASAFFAALDPQAYSGFNLVVGDMACGAWHWASNRVAALGAVASGWQQHPLSPGIYGLSNAFLDTPWPKTEALKRAMRLALASEADPADVLWPALADRSPAPASAMPQTGVDPELERQLSSAWVRLAHGRYGTRASTVVKVRSIPQGWDVAIQEKTWLPDGTQHSRSERLAWPLATAAA